MAVTGLSANPVNENINNFFVFSSPDATFATSGTTPNNRFDFNLATLAETAYYGTSGAAFYGTGALVDTTGYYANTPAAFTIGFSVQGSYSFTMAGTVPIPEPAMMSLLAGAALLLLSLRRKD